MRKRLIAALTVVAVLSFGGVAFAENIYQVHIANSSPKGKGTPSKPWLVKFRKGTYRYVCDPHATTMKGSFKVT